MFRSVIERQRAGRLGAGAWVSIGVHAALFAAVLFISARPPEAPPGKDPYEDMRFVVPQGPKVRRGTPGPKEPQKLAHAPRPRERNRVPRTPQALPTDPRLPEPDTNPTTGTEEVAGTGRGGPEGHPDGDPDGTEPIGPLITGFDLNAVRMPTGEEQLSFGEGMTPPVMLGGQPIEYTPQARAAGVEGTLVAKCVITREGAMRDCRILKGLAHMDASVLEALHSRRYRPVTFQGRSVSVAYSVTVRLKLPR